MPNEKRPRNSKGSNHFKEEYHTQTFNMNRLNILILEDSSERNNWFGKKLIGNAVDFAYTASQANKFLQEKEYDVIFLDHDLAEEHYVAMHAVVDTELIGTGVDTAKFIVENSSSPKAQIIVHSLNTVGSQNIFAILKDAGYNVERIPYLELQKRL